MIDRLKIFHHRNHPPIFELEGMLTSKTILSLLVNIEKDSPFIIQMGGVHHIDSVSANILSDLSRLCSYEIWDADGNAKRAINEFGSSPTYKP